MSSTFPGYVFAGSGDDGDARLYVGEADVLGKRLRKHAGDRDFWTWLVAFTAADENLNKAYVRYLEARLLDLARTAHQWSVDNTAAPGEPPLSEADRADAEWVLHEMLVIYPILGIDAFEIAAEEPTVDDEAPVLVLDQRGGSGRGRETRDGFVVLAGSRARSDEVPSVRPWLRELRQQLLDRGVLEASGDQPAFTQDFRFSSPSRAAAVLVGGAANGRKAWKTDDGTTLRELQDARTAT